MMTMKDFVLLLAGAALGGLVSWFVTWRYYVRAGREQRQDMRVLARGLEKVSQGAPVQFNDRGPLASRESLTAVASGCVVERPDDSR